MERSVEIELRADDLAQSAKLQFLTFLRSRRGPVRLVVGALLASAVFGALIWNGSTTSKVTIASALAGRDRTRRSGHHGAPRGTSAETVSQAVYRPLNRGATACEIETHETLATLSERLTCIGDDPCIASNSALDLVRR